MKKLIYTAMSLLISCTFFSSCEKEDEGISNHLKNVIKDVWDDSYGTTITIDGKEITLPPNDEIWIWVTEPLASDIIDHDDADIDWACGHEVASYKLYNDDGEYVLCLKLTNPIDAGVSGPYIDFDKNFAKRYWGPNKDICYVASGNTAVNIGFKKIVLPSSASIIEFHQDFDENNSSDLAESIENYLEEVYYSENVISLDISLPALKNKIYIPERTVEYEGDSAFYTEVSEIGAIGIGNECKIESLEIPEGWAITYISSETLKTLTLNGTAAPSGIFGNENFIRCPNLENLVLNDETRHLCCDIFCPALKTLRLPEQLIRCVCEISCNIESLIIPEKVNELHLRLGDLNEDGIFDIKSIYYKPLTPPRVNYFDEDRYLYSNTTLYVPSEAFDEYMKLEFFNNLNTVAYNF